MPTGNQKHRWKVQMACSAGLTRNQRHPELPPISTKKPQKQIQTKIKNVRETFEC